MDAYLDVKVFDFWNVEEKESNSEAHGLLGLSAELS